MIAVFITEPATVHAVLEIVREGLKVKAHGYCGAISNAADGTLQIPEEAFDGRPTFSIATRRLKTTWRVCAACAATVKELLPTKWP